jgi:hypothetical protein
VLAARLRSLLRRNVSPQVDVEPLHADIGERSWEFQKRVRRRISKKTVQS